MGEFENKTEFSNANWQTAYLARELRQNKTVTLSCTEGEADVLMEELRFFSNSSPVATTKSYLPGKDQVFMEITNVI